MLFKTMTDFLLWNTKIEIKQYFFCKTFLKMFHLMNKLKHIYESKCWQNVLFGWTILLNLYWFQERISFFHYSHKILLRSIRAKSCSSRTPTVSPPSHCFCVMKKVPCSSSNLPHFLSCLLFLCLLFYIPHDRESETPLHLSHTQGWRLHQHRNTHHCTAENQVCWKKRKQNKG